MKKIILIILISIPFIISCDDQVSPKSDFKEIYILNCIIRSDTSYQIATLSHSYNVEGFDPYTNSEDPFISNASIVITYKGKEYIMKRAAAERLDTSHYKGPIKYFYLDNLEPESFSPIKIEAYLPGGKTLHSESHTFGRNNIFLYSSLREFTTVGLVNGKIEFSWGVLSGPDNSIIYFAPELAVVYSKEVNGVKTKYAKKFPYTYLTQLNDLPVYPPIYSGGQTIYFDSTVVNRAMREIAGDDPNKGSYIIENAIFRLLILDENLATYYSAQQTFLNEFSLRVYQPEFSNIVGGLGLFGTYNFKSINIEMNKSYVAGFGYRTP